MEFKEWLINEAAVGVRNIQYDAQGRPSFRVYILNNGTNVGLEVLEGGTYKYAGDMFSQIFGNADLLKGYKLFNWHSDLPEGSGYGPMFYDICMEIATNKGGHLASMTLANRLAGDLEGARERKGSAGGDTSDRAEPIYKFYYEKRGEVEKVRPAISFQNDPEYETKPWMYVLYRKKPTVLPALIEMNKKGKPVLVAGTGINAKPISDMNFSTTQTEPETAVVQKQNQPGQSPKQPQFQGFQMGDPRTWQQRQQYLNSTGIDTTGWGRAEVMQGRRNKWNN